MIISIFFFLDFFWKIFYFCENSFDSLAGFELHSYLHTRRMPWQRDSVMQASSNSVRLSSRGGLEMHAAAQLRSETTDRTQPGP